MSPLKSPPACPSVRLSALLLAILLACAKFGPPPGGPPDVKPPRLIATRPESTAIIPDFKGDVDFQFDEVVSEGNTPSEGLGTSDLERLIILSPSRKPPVVSWHRERIAVHPKEGWRPNTVYRVELLPGIVDLRRNRDSTGTVLTFTTGAPLPGFTLHGVAVDWVAHRVGRGAVIEAALQPDTLIYRTLADSSGKFSLGPLPKGEYLVSASVDQNKNLRRDPREAFDTARVSGDSVALVPALWIYPHDTVGPRISGISIIDSLAVTISFNQPLDPWQATDSIGARLLLLPDSITLGVRSLLRKADDDSLLSRLRAKADSLRIDSIKAADTTRAPRDTTVRKRRQLPAPAAPGVGAPAGKAPGARSKADTTELKLLAQRPVLDDKLVLRADSVLLPGKKYAVSLTGVRNVNRFAADSRSGFSVPVPKPKPPADSTAADSLKGRSRPDSTARDSTRAQPKP